MDIESPLEGQVRHFIKILNMHPFDRVVPLLERQVVKLFTLVHEDRLYMYRDVYFLVF
jgi:hypothetical protein